MVGRVYSWRVEVAAAAALYVVYEIVRGLGAGEWAVAQLHAGQIVHAEQSLGFFWERGLQQLSLGVPGAGTLLGLAYMGLHFVGTIVFLVWAYRRRRDTFARIRTTIVVATGLALVGYVLYPAAPPRLAGLGIADTVTQHAGVNLSSDALGALYNPLAAVPSLHFGYALLVGAGLATLGSRRWVRRLGLAYPAVMLFVIVATGNHFFLDAAAGALVVLVAWLVARALVRPGARRRETACA